MKYKYIYIILSCSLFMAGCIACKDNNKAVGNHSENTAAQKIKTKEDSAYTAALAIHDAVMPKMGKLIGYQKLTQERIDSLSNMMKKNTPSLIRKQKQQLEALLLQLKTAEKAMNDWMKGFDPEPKLDSSQERIAYFEDQKTKATQMKIIFFAALDSAKQILEK